MVYHMAPMAIFSIVMAAFLVLTVLGVAFLSLALRKPNRTRDFFPRSQHNTNPPSSWVRRSGSYSSEIESISVSPSHPAVFGLPEMKGVAEMDSTTVQVTVTPPTPAKRERRASMMDLEDEENR